MNVAKSRQLRRLSVLLHAGTALPLLLGVSAQAQPIVQYSADDIVIDEDSASGDPVAVDVYTTGGNANVTVQSVTATAADDARADVVYVGVEATGSIVPISAPSSQAAATFAALFSKPVPVTSTPLSGR